MISAQEAWQRLVPHLTPLPEESVPRREARNRVLSQDIDATIDVPALDVSAMDGYALVGPVQPPEVLPVRATIAAGDPPGTVLAARQAAKIMTGAPIPQGADRVLPVERTDGGNDRVKLLESPPENCHIRRRGEIMRAGDKLLAKGDLLTAGALSLAATHGYQNLEVFRTPRVSVLVTGDEVVRPEEQPRPGQLRDSHTDFLLAAGHSLGMDFTSLGLVADRADSLRQKVQQGMTDDVLLITGGVSMGEFDLVEGVLSELGCNILFEKVAVQPAKPVVAAKHDGGLVFGLPGNPASAMVAFWLFVRPTLRRLLGYEDSFWHGALRAELEAPLPKSKGRERFLPADIRFDDGKILVSPLGPKGSHDLAAYGRGTALVRIPAGSAPAPVGAPCEVLPLTDWRSSAR
ncbi:MAG: molybdopterin molybdotransferase MoeA [Deltaproteobacteria bacterium]|nr:molybdopterin molybdotransferase MoeA [Deltaproteobacteria bacterium]